MEARLRNRLREIKELIVQTLELEDISAEDIDDTAPLFGDGLGLDSIDALELGIVLQKTYGLKIDQESDEIREHFMSAQALAKFVEANVK